MIKGEEPGPPQICTGNSRCTKLQQTMLYASKSVKLEMIDTINFFSNCQCQTMSSSNPSVEKQPEDGVVESKGCITCARDAW